MKLIPPSTDFKKSFIDAVKEFKVDSKYPLADDHYKKLSTEELERDFDSYVQKELSHSQGDNLLPEYVPETDLWLVDGDEFIGAVRIRRSLTEHLKNIGGHIGYDIRPSKRKQGYGTQILQLALLEAKKLGIEEVLVTCDVTNTGSRKIIEKNGGVFENQVPYPETGVDKLRFWIHLS